MSELHGSPAQNVASTSPFTVPIGSYFSQSARAFIPQVQWAEQNTQLLGARGGNILLQIQPKTKIYCRWSDVGIFHEENLWSGVQDLIRLKSNGTL